MNLLLFVLAAYGLTQILCYGKIFDTWRPKYGKLGELFSCSMCMGFWVGLFLWSINPYTELFTFDYILINAFLLGCLSSGTSYLLAMLVNDFGLKVNQKE